MVKRYYFVMVIFFVLMMLNISNFVEKYIKNGDKNFFFVYFFLFVWRLLIKFELKVNKISN